MRRTGNSPGYFCWPHSATTCHIVEVISKRARRVRMIGAGFIEIRQTFPKSQDRQILRTFNEPRQIFSTHHRTLLTNVDHNIKFLVSILS